jgi:outer membrane protein OmpA-like peptidoglycan-associated protein
MTHKYSRLFASGCPIVLAMVTGCAADAPPPPPVTPVAYVAPPVEVAAVPVPVTPPATVVHVSQDILVACSIQDVPSGKAPLFAFDSAALSSDDQRLLDEVATCLTTGPLAGRVLMLTGRADPRGTEAYNISLGDRRASQVGSYLERHGMSTAKLNESSRGALDATGNDEAGWITDRRVDVDLAKDPVPVASIP